jgi:hypothetical protein
LSLITEAARGHLVAFSKPEKIPGADAGELVLPDLDEPFGAIDQPAGRTPGTGP